MQHQSPAGWDPKLALDKTHAALLGTAAQEILRSLVGNSNTNGTNRRLDPAHLEEGPLTSKSGLDEYKLEYGDGSVH